MGTMAGDGGMNGNIDVGFADGYGDLQSEFEHPNTLNNRSNMADELHPPTLHLRNNSLEQYTNR